MKVPFKASFKSPLFWIVVLLMLNEAAVIGTLAYNTFGINRLDEEEDQEVRVTLALMEDAYRLKVALERQMVGYRGYMATGQTELLRPFHEARSDFDRTVVGFAQNLHDNRDRELLEDLRRLEAQHRERSDELLNLVRDNRRAEAQRVFLTEISPLKPALVGTADALIRAQRLQVDRLHRQVDLAEDQVRWQLLLSALISAPIGLLLASIFVWRVALPLRELTTASRAIASGQTDVRVPRHYDDEFGEVATTFNRMATSIEQSLRDLQDTNAELRRADRYKDDFLSMVTHELKTPLTSIMGFASMLDRGRNGPLSETQLQSVHKIMSNATRMGALVNDLLDSTLIRQGRLELTLQPTPYRKLLLDTVAQIKPLADQKKIHLEVEPPPEVSPTVDAARIAQVITNLLSNAIKFTPEGGRIALQATVSGNWLLTEVKDTGPGIAEDDIPRLFQPFTKLNAEVGGTGLGLSISRALVEGHGGTMGVASTPGAGSTFSFSLPLG